MVLHKREEEMTNPLELKACPNCNNVGWHIIADINGEPELALCQFCYEEPNSIFNVANALNEQIKEQAELIEKFYKALKDVMSSNKPHSEKARKAFAAYTQWKEKRK